MPGDTVPPVHVLGVEAIDVVHDLGDIAAWCVKDQMIVIAHQAIGEALCAKLLESDDKNHQEAPSIDVVDEDRLPSVAPCHYVIDRAAEYDSMFSTHAPVRYKPKALRQRAKILANCPVPVKCGEISATIGSRRRRIF
jgi:hypothetical protein